MWINLLETRMSLGQPDWQGRKKRIRRRIGFDLRLSFPFLGLALCFVLSATVIFAAERLPALTAGDPHPVSESQAQAPACDTAERAVSRLQKID